MAKELVDYRLWGFEQLTLTNPALVSVEFEGIMDTIPLKNKKVFYSLQFFGARSIVDESFFSTLEEAVRYANAHAKYTFGIEKLNFIKHGEWIWKVWIASMSYTIQEFELDTEFAPRPTTDIERDAWQEYQDSIKR